MEELQILCKLNPIIAYTHTYNSHITYMNPSSPTLALLLLAIATTAIRLQLTPDNPSVQLVFETSGKHTFYAVSSG